MGNNAKGPKIVLDRSRRSRAFGDDERLWKDDLKRLVDMIKTHVDSLDSKVSEKKDEITDEKPTLAIAIFSPAGSGKSSLLKTLVYEAQKEFKNKQENLKNVSSLDILQPARFGDNGQLVYAMVAAGLKAHKEKRGEDLDYDVLTPLLKKYRALSDDLRIIRGDKISDNLESHELTTEVVLRHTSGLNIGKKIEAFVNALADDLNSESNNNSVVLLPVDDLDLDPEQLIKGLSQLQAYLRHPRLVPVFCFTDGLAEDILSNHYIQSLKSADRKRRNNGQMEASEQLAIQYLSKCFPVRTRLRLGAVPASLQTGQLKKNTSGEEQEQVLHLLLAASFLLFGVSDREARHPVRAVLRPSTVRRQFHIIDSLEQAGVKKLICQQIIKSYDSNSPSYNELKKSLKFTRKYPWVNYFDRAVWGVLNVHRDVIQEYGMQMEDLYSWSPSALRRVLLDALLELPDKIQFGLWRRWRNMTDSRHNQVISLLAANTHRPWLIGERPSGEDYSQLMIAKQEKNGEDPNKIYGTIDAYLALLWFVNLTLGFYLPLNRSVFRELRESKHNKEHLGATGWSLHNAAIQAIQTADEDREFFPTGMLFLDSISYATALTTTPRMNACYILDGVITECAEEKLSLKKAKIEILSRRTNALLGEYKKNPADAIASFTKKLSLKTKKTDKWLEGVIEEALEAYKVAADFEIKGKLTEEEEKTDKKVNKSTSYKKIETLVETYLKKHEYTKAYGFIKEELDEDGDITSSEKEIIKKELIELKTRVTSLKATARMVHDDQFLLRVWTCHGYNRGRFWAAVSLWRGLGLIGELIESHRKWQSENSDKKKSDKQDDSTTEGSDKKATPDEIMVKNIIGILHSHSLKGLVPGKGLSEPSSRRDTLELAFPRWNTKNQRDAILRLAARLKNWLDSASEFKVAPLQQNSQESKLDWGQCFIRRLQGEYIAGSLWQWLDVEHFEYQGDQYNKNRRSQWNAGVALTSWIRVLQRYFKGNNEIRWLLDTCPLTSPFLSRSGSGFLHAQLSEKPYIKVLGYVKSLIEDDAKKDAAKEDDAEKDDKKEPALIRSAQQFRKMNVAILELWKKESSWGSPTNPTREEANIFAKEIINNLLGIGSKPGAEKERLEKIFGSQNYLKFFDEKIQNNEKNLKYFIRLLDIAKNVKLSLKKHNKNTEEYNDSFNEHYKRSLLDSFNPRVVESGIKTDSDMGDQIIDSANDVLDRKSVCFELANMILQYLKVSTHASAASLFYQIPRVRRSDFFDEEKKKEADSETQQ